MAVTESSPEKHVAVLAFPFGGHALTLLTLVHKLARAAPNVHFTFFNTAKSNNSLFSTSKPDRLPRNIQAYDVADGVPAGHVLTGNPVEAIGLFLKASLDNYKRSIDLAVAETGKRFTCLLSDAFLTFSGQVAEDMHVPWITIWTSLPHSLSAHVYTNLIREHCLSNSHAEDGALDFIPGFSGIRVADLPKEVLPGDFEESLFSRTLSQIGFVIPRATAVVINFYEKLNPPLLSHDLKSKLQKVFYVGFLSLTLPPPPLPPSSSDPTGCLSWLDGQEGRSVAYVSFGTVASLPHNELTALAEALEESETPFLWSLKDNFKELLPKGFLERTSKQGKIVAWTPQTQVLAHPSICVFVTHCGANSVNESIANGVPMICRPFFGDHYMNGRVVEQVWGIGVKVEGGIITKSGLLKSLEIILGEEQGKEMREKVQALKKIVLEAAGPDGGASQDFSHLAGILSMS